MPAFPGDNPGLETSRHSNTFCTFRWLANLVWCRMFGQAMPTLPEAFPGLEYTSRQHYLYFRMVGNAIHLYTLKRGEILEHGSRCSISPANSSGQFSKSMKHFIG